jgi:hypothetical protein
VKTLANPSDQEEILRRLTLLRPDSQRRWGRMSVHQMLCHLSDSYLTVMGEKKVSPASGLVQRTVMKWFALWVPLPWPHGISTRPEIEQGRGGTPPAEFEADRRAVIDLTNRFSRPTRDFTWSEHAIFGLMQDREWMRWGYLHADHHLRQFGV